MELSIINQRYRVLRELARGGMGCVYVVEDLHDRDRKLALKTILPEAASGEFIERFRVEFAGLAKLSHPNIATAYDFGQIAGTREHFFTTELVNGVDLLRGTADATADQLLSVIVQVLRGLAFIHSHKLLHNDLKPANILLEGVEPASQGGNAGLCRLQSSVFGQSSRVRIIDFGLLSAEDTAWDRVLGTPQYMSPERIRCRKADRRSDLYSAGVVFFSICAREPPFQAREARDILRLHLTEAPPTLSSRRPDLPGAICVLVDRLLRKAPEERWQSAEEAIRHLESALGGTHAVEVETRAHALSAGSLFGRSSELGILEDALARLDSGSAACPGIAITGPSGSGKTRLVEELRGGVQVRGGAFIHVAGAAVEGHLMPVGTAVLRALETCGARGLEHLTRRTSAADPDSSGSLAAELESFLLERAAERPILIHFDDFHAASETVRSFVLGLLSSTHEALRRSPVRPRLLMVVSNRADGASGKARVDGLTEVHLEPFTPESSRAFLRSLFAGQEISGEVLDVLAGAGGGNPGFLLELAREVVERGIVRHSGTRWVFPASLKEVPLPASLQGVVVERWNALGPDLRALVEWLACSPSSIAVPVLARSTRLDIPGVSSRLHDLCLRGLVQLEAQGAAGQPARASLAHGDLRRAVEAGQEAERRRFLHQRLAQAIEEELGPTCVDDSSASESLAFHWLEAGNEAGFLRYASKASSALRRGGDFTRAVAFEQRIADVMPPDASAKKIKCLLRLSELHELGWDLERSRRNIEAALEIGGQILRPADRSALHRRLAGLAIAGNEHGSALREIAEARRALGSTEDAAARLALDALEAWAAWLELEGERSRAALARAEQVLASASFGTAREKAAAAGALNVIGALHHQLGRLREARAAQERQLALLDGPGSDQALAATRCALGGVLLDLGEATRARQELESALGAARRIGDRRTLCRARERLGELHLRHGDAKQALLITQACMQEAEALGNPAPRANALRTLGRIYLRAGQELDAETASMEALEIHTRERDLVQTPLTRILAGRVLLDRAQHAQALAHARTAQDESRALGMPIAEGLAVLLEEEVRLALGEAPALDRISAHLGRFQECGCAHEECELKLFAARAQLAAGAQEAARELLESAEGVLGRAGSHEQKARYNLLLALLEAESGRIESAVRRLSEVEAQSRNSVLPRLARQCKEARGHLEKEAVP